MLKSSVPKNFSLILSKCRPFGNSIFCNACLVWRLPLLISCLPAFSEVLGDVRAVLAEMSASIYQLIISISFWFTYFCIASF